MNKKILILGEGFIGRRLQEELRCPISGNRIHSFRDAERQIKKFKPKIIINCIGYTGRDNVDGCEFDIDKTLAANTFSPIILTEAALRNKIKLVHISSGCIYHYDFEKNMPKREKDIPDFSELYYSRSKIYAERVLDVFSERTKALILRIRIPLDNRPHPKNILTKLIKYRKVIDLENSITYIPDFIQALKHLIKIDAWGIYNLVNAGRLSYPVLLDFYKKYVPDFEYEVIDFEKLNLTRTNLILSTKKLKNTGFKVRSIHEVLDQCVRSYLKY
ncbi:MAG: sugar nucleotide-binding protein [Candidatus Omnitrophota bacterium]